MLASHLGRPKGDRVDAMSLSPVAPVLAEKLGVPVLFLNDCIGPDVEMAVQEMAEGQVALLLPAVAADDAFALLADWRRE